MHLITFIPCYNHSRLCTLLAPSIHLYRDACVPIRLRRTWRRNIISACTFLALVGKHIRWIVRWFFVLACTRPEEVWVRMGIMRRAEGRIPTLRYQPSVPSQTSDDSPLVIQRAIRHLAFPQKRPDIRIPPIQNRMHPHKLRPICICQRSHAQPCTMGIASPCPHQECTYVPALGTSLEFRQSAFHAAAVAD